MNHQARRSVWRAGLVLVSLAAFSPAVGQQATENGPIRLVPSNQAPATNAAESPPPGQAAPRPADTSVAVIALDRPDPSSVGVLTAAEGGFEVSLWAGSRRSLVEALLPRIPAVTPSRALQSLRKRLLLTTAQVPSGVSAAPSFLGLRVERLAAAGDYPSALALAALAPPQIDDPALDIVRVEGALLSGNHQSACEVVEAVLATGRRSPYWVRRLAFCRVLEGDLERAVLTAAVLREFPGEPDALFDQLLTVLADGTDAPVVSTTPLTPLHFAMIRAARRALPDSAADTTDPAMLRAIATSANASIEARLRAAEAAEIAGVLSPESLAQVYASIAFNDVQRANVLSAALDMPRPFANALLFQAAVAEEIPAAQAEALQTALRLANVRAHGMIARVNADRLAALTPSSDLMWFGNDAGLALLHADRKKGARAWFDTARQIVSESQPDAAAAVLGLWAPLTVSMTEDPLPWVPSALAEWWDGVASIDLDRAQGLGAVAFAAFDAVGLVVPDETWDAFTVMTKPVLVQRPSLGALRGLHAAARGGRVGETVLFALVILGEAHPGEVDAGTLSRVIAALAEVGLSDDARVLALEAIVGRSL